MHVDEAIRSRKLVWRFLPTPVPTSVVRRILSVAALAPSGSNVQRWKVCAVVCEARRRLCDAFIDAATHQADRYQPEYAYYSATWVEPYLERRHRWGFGLYANLGIVRDDSAAPTPDIAQPPVLRRASRSVRYARSSPERRELHRSEDVHQEHPRGRVPPGLAHLCAGGLCLVSQGDSDPDTNTNRRLLNPRLRHRSRPRGYFDVREGLHHRTRQGGYVRHLPWLRRCALIKRRSLANPSGVSS